jgi:acyl-CoA synthetase (NDP forming)
MVGVVLTMVTGELGAELADGLVEASRRLDKPLFVTWLAGRDQTVAGRSRFRQAGMPVFSSVGDFARTAGLLAPGVWAARDETSAPPDAQAKAAADLLRDCVAGSAIGEELLHAVGIAVPRCTLVTDPDGAATAAEQLDGAVAMKIHAGSLAHKSDLGGVRLNVPPGDVARTFAELEALADRHAVEDFIGILLQEMIPPGVELIIGGVGHADGYAPTITVGIGGVATELYRDVASELAPVTRDQAEALLRRLRGWPLLSGFRGAPPADVDAAARAVASVSRVIASLADEHFEFEINPLIVAEEGRGAYAVDILARGPAESNPMTTPGQDNTSAHHHER